VLRVEAAPVPDTGPALRELEERLLHGLREKLQATKEWAAWGVALTRLRQVLTLHDEVRARGRKDDLDFLALLDRPAADSELDATLAAVATAGTRLAVMDRAALKAREAAEAALDALGKVAPAVLSEAAGTVGDALQARRQDLLASLTGPEPVRVAAVLTELHAVEAKLTRLAGLGWREALCGRALPKLPAEVANPGSNGV
jgi:hypothetical protein